MSELNENHKNTLLIGFRYVDGLLSDIENIMSTSEKRRSPFPQHLPDITPQQCRLVSDQISCMRTAMCRILNDKGIEIRHPQISAVKAVINLIHFIDIAMEEKRPRYMKGYGGLTEAAARELEELVSEMKRPIERMLDALHQGSTIDQF